MGRSKILVPTACKKKIGKFLRHAFSWYREKTLGSVFPSPWFPSLWFSCRCHPLWMVRPFKCVCWEGLKPGSGVHSKTGRIPSECCECQKPCEPLLGFHLAGRCPIETISPGISWDLRSCFFSYWVRQEKWSVHVRTGTDSFHFHAIKKKVLKLPIPSPSPFTVLFPVAFPSPLSF